MTEFTSLLLDRPVVLVEPFGEPEPSFIRLMPVFVPRRFSAPGQRLRLHPDDYFALGTRHYGGHGRGRHAVDGVQQ